MQDITHVGEDNIFIEVVRLVYDVTDYTSKLTLSHPNSLSLTITHPILSKLTLTPYSILPQTHLAVYVYECDVSCHKGNVRDNAHRESSINKTW